MGAQSSVEFGTKTLKCRFIERRCLECVGKFWKHEGSGGFWRLDTILWQILECLYAEIRRRKPTLPDFTYAIFWDLPGRREKLQYKVVFEYPSSGYLL